MCGAVCFLKMKCVSALLIRSCRHLLMSRLMFHPPNSRLLTSLFNPGCRQDKILNARQYTFIELACSL